MIRLVFSRFLIFAEISAVGLFQDYDYYPLSSHNWYLIIKGNDNTERGESPLFAAISCNNFRFVVVLVASHLLPLVAKYAIYRGSSNLKDLKIWFTDCLLYVCVHNYVM